MTKNRVTDEEVRANMQDVLIRTEVEFGKPVTYVSVCMKNGFTVRESYTCVDPANYDESTGARICLKKIEDEIYMLLAYELQCKMATKKPDAERGEQKLPGDAKEPKIMIKVVEMDDLPLFLKQAIVDALT